jgi:hypothetical protein
MEKLNLDNLPPTEEDRLDPKIESALEELLPDLKVHTVLIVKYIDCGEPDIFTIPKEEAEGMLGNIATAWGEGQNAVTITADGRTIGIISLPQTLSVKAVRGS